MHRPADTGVPAGTTPTASTPRKTRRARVAKTEDVPAPEQHAGSTSHIGTAGVMQPSAKSLLERREKAMREGRRKDAKFSDVERRIVRRLRNRESAERCRLRRLQQALLLESRVDCMQKENERLLSDVARYKFVIQRYEGIIADYSKRAPSSSDASASCDDASAQRVPSEGGCLDQLAEVELCDEQL